MKNNGRFQRRIATAFLEGAEFVDASMLRCSRWTMIAIAKRAGLVCRKRQGLPSPYFPTARTARWIERVMAGWQQRDRRFT